MGRGIGDCGGQRTEIRDEPAHSPAPRLCCRRADPDCAAGVRASSGDDQTSFGGVQLRVDGAVEIIREDLARESAGIAERLASLESALLNDNKFRLAAVAGVESERGYLLDYAGTAMRLTGLSMLQIQDSDDRIISSGHFRNEHGRAEPGLASALQNAGGVAFVTTRGPSVSFSHSHVPSRS